MPSVKESILIYSSADRVYHLIKQFEDYPRFIPLVKEVKVIDTVPEQTVITEWRAEIDGIPFHWIEQDEFDPHGYGIRYKLIQGDMEQYEGQWQIKPIDGGIELELTVCYSLGVPSIEELMGLIMHDSLVENTKEMLLRIKHESELQ